MPFSPVRSAFLVRLCHHRWAAPVAAEIARRDGCRFVELQSALKLSPASLRNALEAVFALGLADRNPGYGHPLRPEYMPTAAGLLLVGPWLSLWRAVGESRATELAARKWTLPALDAIASGNQRFAQIEEALAGITPRALAATLRDLVAAGLVQRTVEASFPPAPVYTVTASGRRIARRLVRLGETVGETTGEALAARATDSSRPARRKQPPRGARPARRS